MTALPLIAAAVSSMTDYPVKTYNECIAEGLDLDKILDIELIHKYSIPESNDTVLGSKKKLQSMFDIKLKNICLSFSCKPLEDHRTLEYSDNKWLETDKNSWPVSFHGTSKDAAENIAQD
ncbi:23589_t:CDS:2, partial [Gigaspora rosea]